MGRVVRRKVVQVKYNKVEQPTRGGRLSEGSKEHEQGQIWSNGLIRSDQVEFDGTCVVGNINLGGA